MNHEANSERAGRSRYAGGFSGHFVDLAAAGGSTADGCGAERGAGRLGVGVPAPARRRPHAVKTARVVLRRLPATPRISIDEFAKRGAAHRTCRGGPRRCGSRRSSCVSRSTTVTARGRSSRASRRPTRRRRLVGRHVVLVANLQPAKLMGIESNGMVLAALDAEWPAGAADCWRTPERAPGGLTPSDDRLALPPGRRAVRRRSRSGGRPGARAPALDRVLCIVDPLNADEDRPRRAPSRRHGRGRRLRGRRSSAQGPRCRRRYRRRPSRRRGAVRTRVHSRRGPERTRDRRDRPRLPLRLRPRARRRSRSFAARSRWRARSAGQS